MEASHPVPPYGPAIHAAVAKGDLAEMKKVAAEAEQWLQQAGHVPAALELLKAAIAKHEHKAK
jgi:hypothetical protein